MTAERIEFGVARTECACSACILNCRYLPGSLIPAVLNRILYSDNKLSNLTIKFQT
jgi:hypothetical protein